MISPIAIDNYLKRELDDFRWLKALPDNQLDEWLYSIKPTPKFKEPLNRAQKVGFILGVAHKHWVYHMEMGCVDCDTEYLSPTGWRRMDQYDGGKVAQYWPETGKADFVQPTSYMVKPCREMYRFKTSRNGIDQKLSEEHRVLYIDRQGKLQVASAGAIADKHASMKWGWEGRIITSFNIEVDTSLPLTDAELRVQVAVIADSTFPKTTTNNRCYVAVKKDRKKIRLRKLLENAGLEWTEKSYSEGYITFGFNAPRRDKIFNDWYWQASYHQLEIISDECRHWDGMIKVFNKVGFYTRERASADFIQYAFAATGKSAQLHWQIHPRDGQIDYSVMSQEKPALSWLRGVTNNSPKNPISIEPTTDGKKYCFEVPSTFLVFRRNGCVFLSGNTGKSRLALELLKWYIDNGYIERALVLANSDTVVQGWQDEILRWEIGIPFKILLGSSAAKWDMLESFNLGIAVATHTGFATMVSELVPNRKGKGDRNYQPVPEHIEYMRDKFGAVVIDESTRVGNNQTLAFKVCNAVMGSVDIRYALAGRLFGRSPMPVWSQFYLVDRGDSFGPTLGLFREVFFKAKRGYFGGMEYTFNKQREPDFQRLLGHRSIYFAIDEVTDLPELSRVRKHCMFPDETLVYYRRCVDEILHSKGNYREMQNAFLRMRQISSGFVGVIDDDEGETTEIEFPVNPKLDLLIELLQELPEGKKAVVFHEFRWSGRQIADALRKAKIPFGQLNAETKDWDKVKNRFNTTDIDNILVVSWRKGGYGLNLQSASYMFFFESPVGALDRDQCERRIWRQGQRNRCFIYDLLMKDSVDSRIIMFHSHAANLFEALVRDPSLIEDGIVKE